MSDEHEPAPGASPGPPRAPLPEPSTITVGHIAVTILALALTVWALWYIL
jgi:hypothetical protein